MATFQESFLYPLILLLLGAGLSWWLGSWLTKRWQNNKEKLDIKVEIVSKIDETIMRQILKALSLTSKEKMQKVATGHEQDAEYENIRNWYFLEAKTIQSKLNNYFPGAKLDTRWNTYAITLNEFILALLVYLIWNDPQDKKSHVSSHTKRISEYIKSTGNKKYGDLATRITSNFNTGNDLMSDLIAMFYFEGGNLKRDIMKARIEIF